MTKLWAKPTHPTGSFSTFFVREVPNDQFTLVQQEITFTTDDFSVTEHEIVTGSMREVMLKLADPHIYATSR